MCGIIGIKGNFPVSYLDKAINSLKHRGPNHSDIYHDNNILLGHVRLSILDTSENGHQPMQSLCKRYVIVFNGEIYNHNDIRQELLGKMFNHTFYKSSSDTETLVNMFTYCDIDEVLEYIEGMYAFALWDKKNQSLTLVRDRVGEKPLYYGLVNNNIFFASELKSLYQLPDYIYQENEEALFNYFQYNFIPDTKTIHKDIYQLSPASYITLKNRSSNIQNQRKYWHVKPSIKKLDYSSNRKHIKNLLTESVKKQMISDVPIGCFLSGGIDSSLIASIMSNVSNNKIKTFTISFGQKEYNEASKAKNIAEFLGTENYVYNFTSSDIINTIDNIKDITDQPFGDLSIIPTNILSKFAKQHVTVCLSGDGGDELFGGYNRYLTGYRLWKKMAINNKHLSRIYDRVRSIPFLNVFLKDIHYLKIKKLLDTLDVTDIDSFYNKVLSNQYLDNIFISEFNENFGYYKNVFDDELTNLMYSDFNNYLHSDVLVKVDRASMYYSLETRAPFLDKKLIEASFSMHINNKISTNHGKLILRNILKDYVPIKLIDSGKSGFSVPMSEYLRKDLYSLAHDLINSNYLRQHSIINHKNALKLLENHKQKRLNAEQTLWNLMVYITHNL